MKKFWIQLLSLTLLNLAVLDASPRQVHADWNCPKIFRSLPWIKSGEERLLELAEVKEKIGKSDESYQALLESVRALEGISESGTKSFVVRSDLKKAAEALQKLQQKRHALEKRYFTIPLKEDYIGEVIGVEWIHRLRSRGIRIHYMDANEREYYRVTIDESGRIWRADGRLWNGHAIFVMDQEGSIFAAEEQTPVSIGKRIRWVRHSSFLAGRPVAAAGTFYAKNGKIELVTAASGHYQPSKKAVRQFLKRLEENGLDVSKIKYERGY